MAKDKKNKVLVTGSAGFIGFYVCERFLRAGWEVIGLDCLTDYYSVALKKEREKIFGPKARKFFRVRRRRRRRRT